MDNKTTGLEKIISSDSTVLILGTFPSQESLRLRMYYANLGNQFWKIMGCLFDFDPKSEYPQRVKILLVLLIMVHCKNVDKLSEMAFNFVNSDFISNRPQLNPDVAET